ncbi:MAG: hypothetical protein GX069_04840 [Tissierellia bacterium]|nr:hypothetical protein [Tissierellia bacterium]
MNQANNKYMHPAVPPLYPTDPCKKRPYIPDPILDDPYDDYYNNEPIYYEPMPYDPYGPYPHDPYGYYPHDPYMEGPMMDHRLMNCIRLCMRMGCGRRYKEYYE